MEDVTSIVRIQRAVECAHAMTDIELLIILIVWVSKATPEICLDLDDTSSQLKLEGWLCIVFYF